jgi:hypothetical protein
MKKEEVQVQKYKPSTRLIKSMKRIRVEALEVWTAVLLFLMAVDLASWHGALIPRGTRLNP